MADLKHKSSNDGVGVEGEGELELVAKRRDDSSWHPCKVSLCSDKVGLNVEYVNGSNDVILTKEEALAQLRVGSASLYGDECTLIKEGEHVLAIPKSESKDIFFEAEVEKHIHVQHSKKHCRCTFVVRWNCPRCEGETAVLPLSSIMKMSATCINIHPTIVAFFAILKTSVCHISPLPSVVEGTTDWEMDDFKLETEGSDCELDDFKLDKQIEEISNSVAAFVVESSKKLVFGTQGISLSPLFNSRKEKEQNASQTPPIIKVEPVKSRTPVNPQAAVASLVLKKSQFSGSPDSLSTSDGAKVLKPQAEVVEMSKVGMAYNASFVNNSSNVDDNSITTEAAIAKYVQKNNNIVKKLFSTKEATRDPRISDTSCEASDWEEIKNEKFHEEFVVGASNTASSATNDKLSKASRSSRRITEPKLVPSAIRARRLTRSAIREAEADKTNKEKPSSVQGKDLLEVEKIGVPICGSETASTFFKKMKDKVGNRGMCDDRDSEENCFVRVQASIYSRRLTRSAAHRQTEDNNMKHDKGFEEDRLSEILIGNMTSESEASEKRDSITLPLCDGICLSHGAGRRKKVQKSAPVKKIAQKTEGVASSNHACCKGVKRKTITHTKHLRKSPRLGFLPQTRSQVES